jgi:transposase
MEVAALHKDGWSVSAIARHLGRDRKTVRRYLSDEVTVGVRARSTTDPFDRVEPYVRQRLADDPHLRATVLLAEVAALGWPGAYQTLTRKLRERRLRPHCEPCAGVKGRATVDIAHPAGEETQWDWLELADTPWGQKAYVLVGALAHSGKFRVWFSDCDDQAHLVVGLDEVSRRLGGVTRLWRFDRMATVINPQTGKTQASFIPVARHYGIRPVPCPPRRGNRKGVVEKAIDYLTQSWWRTAPVGSLEQAQTSADRWCEAVADRRIRLIDPPAGLQEPPGGEDSDQLVPDTGQVGSPRRQTVAEAAAGEPLGNLPTDPYPAEVTLIRKVAVNGLVAVWGNRYSVPPTMVGADVEVRWRIGTDHLHVVTPAGTVAATHRLAPRGANRTIRLPEHTAALENVVLASFSTERPCTSKLNRPPSAAAQAIAAEITAGSHLDADPVIDLGVYQRFIDNARSDGV